MCTSRVLHEDSAHQRTRGPDCLPIRSPHRWLICLLLPLRGYLARSFRHKVCDHRDDPQPHPEHDQRAHKHADATRHDLHRARAGGVGVHDERSYDEEDGSTLR